MTKTELKDWSQIATAFVVIWAICDVILIGWLAGEAYK